MLKKMATRRLGQFPVSTFVSSESMEPTIDIQNNLKDKINK